MPDKQSEADVQEPGFASFDQTGRTQSNAVMFSFGFVNVKHSSIKLWKALPHFEATLYRHLNFLSGSNASSSLGRFLEKLARLKARWIQRHTSMFHLRTVICGGRLVTFKIWVRMYNKSFLLCRERIMNSTLDGSYFQYFMNLSNFPFNSFASQWKSAKYLQSYVTWIFEGMRCHTHNNSAVKTFTIIQLNDKECDYPHPSMPRRTHRVRGGKATKLPLCCDTGHECMWQEPQLVAS